MFLFISLLWKKSWFSLIEEFFFLSSIYRFIAENFYPYMTNSLIYAYETYVIDYIMISLLIYLLLDGF